MDSERECWPLIVVGSGAAGMLAGLFAARGGVRTLLCETRAKPGAKIRVSGGGRCNVLPSRAQLEDFNSQGSRNALRKLLQSWPLDEVRAFFEQDLGIALKVEDTGKMFPVSDNPREIVAALLEALQRAGAELRTAQRVTQLSRVQRDAGPRFALEVEGGEPLHAERVILASGGFSLPKTGSDGAGWEMARELGHELLPDYPALVPLLAAEPEWAELSGIALPARLRAMRDQKCLVEASGDLLITHRGFSGPVVLDISWAFARPLEEGLELRASWLPDAGHDWRGLLQRGGSISVLGALRELLPRRFAAHLIEAARVQPERKLSELRKSERGQLLEQLESCPLRSAGNEGYRTAEVTGGGVQLADLNSRSLESRHVPGLSFAGEIVDVTGRIGGFNFLWAWVSGRLAGEAVAREIGRSDASVESPGV